MVEIKQNLANKANYGKLRNTDVIKYIVIHYTGNDGDTDENNGNYFKNNIVTASAHYFVDSDSITQSVPDNYVAWSVGGKKYNNTAQTGGGKLYDICTNTNSLSVELCDDVRDGRVYPTDKTIENALDLTRKLMAKYHIPPENVIRHFDVTGKACPAYWCGSTQKNTAWEYEFKKRLGETPAPIKTEAPKVETPKVQTSEEQFDTNYRKGQAYLTTAIDGLNIRKGAGTDKQKLATLPKGTRVVWYGYFYIVNGSVWKKVQVSTGSKKGLVGYVSANYLR